MTGVGTELSQTLVWTAKNRQEFNHLASEMTNRSMFKTCQNKFSKLIMLVDAP